MIPQAISHYRIIDRLGAGGMGEVFLAEDVHLDRKVAIKMLPARSIGNEQAKKRLFREAKAAATLDHPNICSIYEVGEDADCAFIAMQYIEGRTLSRIIKDNPMSPLEVVNIGIQALEALAEAHSHGVIHRDIKPQNVIITPRGQVKILDFGLAKIVKEVSSQTAETESRLTDTGEVVGTVGYMSPEQLRDLPVDARTDLFSLGVMLYECATGKPAFVGSSKIQISLQVIEVAPQRPSKLNANIPAELDDIILKALAKNVDARYQSANAMLEDLRRVEHLLQGSVLDTRPLTLKPRTSWSITAPASLSAKARTAPFRLTLGIILILVLIFGIWWAVRSTGPTMHQPSPEARKWYDDGTRAMREGAFYEASKQLEQSIVYDDGFLLAHARLAQTYLELDNTDKAREELLRALSLVRDQPGISSRDSAYVDAVAATVGQRLTKALEHYTALFNQAPESEKAQASLELGRAYERTENIEKAQEYYQKAIQSDSQLAAGHLRLAILYGRRQDFKNAEDEFTQAENLYERLSNEEGRAEVFYQRGTLVAKTDKLPEAKKLLDEALDIALKAKNEYQIVKTTLQLSALAYAQGETRKATELATEAIARARNSRIQYLATGGLIDLGYALMYQGNLEEAGKHLRQALEFAQSDKSRSNEARATLGLGALSRQKGNPEEAITLIEKALVFYKDAGYPKETSTALIELAGAHSDKGEVEIAMQTFEEQLKVASELGDLAQLASVHSSLGGLLGVEQEKYPEGLAHVEESYRLNALRGAKSRAGYNQMNRASLLYQLGRYKEAHDALNEAASIADPPSQPEARLKTLLAWVHVIRSQVALSEGRFTEAIKEGNKALELGARQYKDIDVYAKYSIGLSEALSGAIRPARQVCQEAAAMASESKWPRLISSAQLALAEVLLLANDFDGALSAALEAQPVCARSGQQDSEWRAWLMAARASLMAGRRAEAQTYASKAQALCDGLRERWGPDAYEGYLRRPDIRIYRGQIDQILSQGK